jgi:hypothetical protein
MHQCQTGGIQEDILEVIRETRTYNPCGGGIRIIGWMARGRKRVLIGQKRKRLIDCFHTFTCNNH